MTSFVNRIFSVALFAVIACAGTAQAAQQAKFHLPFEAKWGKMLLPPGDYRVDLPQLSVGPQQFFVNGQDTKGYVPPTTTEVNSFAPGHANKSYLRLVKVDGVFYVSRFESAPSGITFTFRVPKAAHRVEMSAQEVVHLGVSGN